MMLYLYYLVMEIKRKIYICFERNNKRNNQKICYKKMGKSWLINLINMFLLLNNVIINIYSTAKIGYNLISKFDKEFELNKQKKVDMLKRRIYSLLNIC